MTKPAKADIDAVLLERFPLLHLMRALDPLNRHYAAREVSTDQGESKPVGQFASDLASVDAARAELEAMQPEQVAKLAAASRARQAAQSAAFAAAQRAKVKEKAARAEAARFYNQPAAKADFAFWCKADYWTIDEAAALLLGRDPRTVNPASLTEELKKPTGFLQLDKPMGPARFHRDFDGLRTLIARAGGLGGPRIRPQDLIAWAQATGAAVVPVGLSDAIHPEAIAPAPGASAPEAAEPPTIDTLNGKRWTPKRIEELRRYRKEHGTKMAAQHFGITASRVRALLPKQEARPEPANPFQVLTHRLKDTKARG